MPICYLEVLHLQVVWDFFHSDSPAAKETSKTDSISTGEGIMFSDTLGLETGTIIFGMCFGILY